MIDSDVFHVSHFSIKTKRSTELEIFFFFKLRYVPKFRESDDTKAQE